jgi:two-component system, OmpR family, sensor histidine kinase MprB
VSIRTRLGILFTLLTLLTATSVGWFAYQSAESNLYQEARRGLVSATKTLIENRSTYADATAADPVLLDPLELGIYSGEARSTLQGVRAQVLNFRGQVLAISPAGGVPTSTEALRVSTGAENQLEERIAAEGQYLLVLSTGSAEGEIVQVARQMDEVLQALDDLRSRIFIIVLTAALLAFTLAVIATTGALRRLERMTERVVEIADSGRLSQIPSSGNRDEISRLTVAFNRMAERLALSRSTRERLIQDAGHEIKTPLTSLRTNIEVLKAFGPLSKEQERELLDDLSHEAEVLGVLIEEMIDASVDPETIDSRGTESVDLRAVVGDAVERARRRYAREVTLGGGQEAVRVDGDPRLLRRAIDNLLDNAAKYSPAGQPIEVTLVRGNSSTRLTVADRGPGLPSIEQNLFARHWRGDETLPGSGIGLAIVREVAYRHGGTTQARNRVGGGSEFDLILPIAPSAEQG